MKNKLFASRELIEYAFIQSIHVSDSINQVNITKECVNSLGPDECMNIYMKKCNTVGIDYEYLYKLQREVIDHMITVGLSTPAQNIVDHFKSRYVAEDRIGLYAKWPQLFMSWRRDFPKAIVKSACYDEDFFST